MDWNKWSMNRKRKFIAMCLVACTALSVSVGAHAMVEPTPDVPAQTEPAVPSAPAEPPVSSPPSSALPPSSSLPASSAPPASSELPPDTSPELPDGEGPMGNESWADGIPSAPDGSNHVSSQPQESSGEGTNSGSNWSGGFSSSKPNTNSSKTPQKWEDTEAPENPQSSRTYSSYSPPEDADEDEIDDRASSLTGNKNAPDVLSSQNWDELLTDNPVSNDPEEPVFGEEPVQGDTSSQASPGVKSDFPWLLVFGIILIVLGLTGIGYFIYSQFFSEEDLTKKQNTAQKNAQRYTDINSDSSGKQNRGVPPEPANKLHTEEPHPAYTNVVRPPSANGPSRPVDPTADTDYIPPIPPVPPVQPIQPASSAQQAAARRQAAQQNALQRQKQAGAPQTPPQGNVQQQPRRPHAAQGTAAPQHGAVKGQAPPTKPEHLTPPSEPQAQQPASPAAPAKPETVKAQAQPVETPLRKDFDWEKFFSEDERK